mmetsp:Transcript_16903/g.32008  ORF Transcript_16903/g.32008 Transcript_16903/m.32008 type:complete len:83 (+) Transcript_16903:277-525(+)|eukprot:CAMPEP_0170170310 /NCGR_PEP_ID=MMETSP0040_2-20121228/3293_1 /TAXON_ID=641309 /ORGANISM="Lotharella oceanica, Strain CCMP622" /LENGTH=82 /DNA_ID=CAMNT_0010409635 /DNA_START=262 /DNA_END=510 /DNA_ORIENTATION=-
MHVLTNAYIRMIVGCYADGGMPGRHGTMNAHGLSTTTNLSNANVINNAPQHQALASALKTATLPVIDVQSAPMHRSIRAAER